MEIIKKFWKYILGAVVILGATGIFIASVTADPNDPVISIVNAEDSIYTQGTNHDSFELSATITIPFYAVSNTKTVEQLAETNLVWQSLNPQVFAIKGDTSGNFLATAYGLHINVQANKAGSTQVRATFYYKEDADGNILDAVYTPGDTSFKSIAVDSNPYLSTFVWKTLPNGDEYNADKIYDFGSVIKFQGNTYTEDPLTVWSRNNVVTYQLTSIDQGQITLVKGGISDVYIGPLSAYDEGSNTFDPNLTKHVTIMGAVRFSNHNLFELPVDHYGPYDFSTPSAITSTTSNINDKDNGVVYTSTNENIAVMDNSILEPKGAGYARIKAGIWDDTTNDFLIYHDTTGSLKDVDSSDYLDVKIPFVWLNDPVAKTQITKNLNVNDTLQLLTNAPEGAKVVFTTNDTDVIALENGKVTALQNGTATITARITIPEDTANGFPELTETITATINVSDSFAVVTDTQSISVGETTKVTAVGAPDGAEVTFTIDGRDITAVPGLTGKISSANPNILEVTGVKEGTYEIVATTNYGGINKRAVCLIYVKTSVTEITISPSSLIMGVDETATLRVTVDPNNAFNKNVTWVSSDPSVVEVNLDTKTDYEVQVTSKKGGVAMITAVSVSDGTKYATCTINVRENVTGVKLNYNELTVNLKEGNTRQMIATVFPENTTGMNDGVNRNVKWSSTNTEILTVDETGFVTFLKPGTAAVIVTTEDGGFQDYCNVTVQVPVESLEITNGDLILSVGDEVALTTIVLPINSSVPTVEWSVTTSDSSDTESQLATVDPNGLLKALAPGHCVVFCRATDGSGVEDYINVYIRQPVSNVTLNTKEITVRKGDVFWLYATVLPENADLKVVDWTSSDETLATVGPDGKVTALMPGKVTITATSQDTGDFDFCVVTIEEPVQGIRLLTGDAQTLFVGAQFTIVPEVLPIEAPNKNVTFVSSNESIATVDENGVVTAVMGGECDIIVTTEERQLKALCHITVKEYVSTITLDRTFAYINIGSYTDLIATITTDTATNKNILWRTANSGVATVDQNGHVTAVNYGTTVITAVAEDGGGATASCVIQVVEPVTSISLSASELHLVAGDTYIIGATVSPGNASVKALKWETTNAEVATVDEDGEVTAVAAGKCRIYARATDGNDVSAYCTVYVTNRTVATALTLNSSAITIRVDDTRQLTVKSTPTQITEGLAWYSTDTGVVTVDQNGNIRGISEGTAEVVVYGVESGVEGRCQVTVLSKVIKATGIKINSTEITMLAGKTRALVTRLVPTNSTEGIRWYSSDTSVVAVDNSGKITTVGPGQATVTAVTATTGIEASCIVHSIALNRTSLNMQQYDPFQLYVDGAPSRVSWRTNNPRIATVSSTGEVIGRKEGTTTITATVDGKTLTCTVTITEATKD